MVARAGGDPVTYHPIDTYLRRSGLEEFADTLPPHQRSALLRAGRGAEHLDEVDPDWYLRLEPMLGWLCMSDACLCVGGLLRGHYYTALAAWHLDEEEARDMGFSAVDSTDPWVLFADYRALTECWRTLCQARCAGRAL